MFCLQYLQYKVTESNLIVIFYFELDYEKIICMITLYVFISYGIPYISGCQEGWLWGSEQMGSTYKEPSLLLCQELQGGCLGSQGIHYTFLVTQ